MSKNGQFSVIRNIHSDTSIGHQFTLILVKSFCWPSLQTNDPTWTSVSYYKFRCLLTCISWAYSCCNPMASPSKSEWNVRAVRRMNDLRAECSSKTAEWSCPLCWEEEWWDSPLDRTSVRCAHIKTRVSQVPEGWGPMKFATSAQ